MKIKNVHSDSQWGWSRRRRLDKVGRIGNQEPGPANTKRRPKYGGSLPLVTDKYFTWIGYTTMGANKDLEVLYWTSKCKIKCNVQYTTQELCRFKR